MFEFKVTPDEGEAFDVSADSRDVLAWEKRGQGRALHVISSAMRLVHMYEIAHMASRRQGLTSLNEADFQTSCVIEIQEPREPDPTNPAA
jgi:hypothetical protein